MTPAVTRAQLVRAMAAFEDRGHPVTCARLCPNGDVLLLTGTPDDALPSNDDSDWVDLAGAQEISRA